MTDLNDCSDLRIVCFLSDRMGVGHYRCVLPLTILKRHGAQVLFIDRKPGSGNVLPLVDFAVFDGCTHIIFQRVADPEAFEKLAPVLFDGAGRRKEGSPTVVFECDDDILRIDPKNPAAHRKEQQPIHKELLRQNRAQVVRGAIGPAYQRATEKNVRLCDALFVSTPELAARWSYLNSRVYVLPNSIDFSIRNWGKMADRHPDFKDRLVLGWAGGLHHFGDEAPLVGVIRPILQRHPEVILALCSNPAVVGEWIVRWDVEDLKDSWTGILPVPFNEYPQILSQFDIGLAPLEGNIFNLSKSELRLLEYGAQGVPYVASKIAPYLRFHTETDGLGGYLASNKEEWRFGIEQLITSYEDRAVKSAAIAAVVREKYDTATVALRWAAALREVRSGHGVSVWEQRTKPGRNSNCPCGSGKRYKKCCLPAFG